MIVIVIDIIHLMVLPSPQSPQIMIQTNKMIIAHHQVCYYNAGAMFDIVDPGAENKAEEGVVDEVLRFYINNTLSAT